MEQAESQAKEIESLVPSKEGVILASQKISVQTLSYPIKKQSSGYFGNLTFQLNENRVKEIKEALEKNSNILRHLMIVKTPPGQIKVKKIRRPLFLKEKQTIAKSSAVSGKKSGEKLDVESLDKKLDEILNE